MEADALSTAFMVLGKEETARYLQSHPGIEVLLIDQKGQLYGTPFFLAQLPKINSFPAFIPSPAGGRGDLKFNPPTPQYYSSPPSQSTAWCPST